MELTPPKVIIVLSLMLFILLFLDLNWWSVGCERSLLFCLVSQRHSIQFIIRASAVLPDSGTPGILYRSQQVITRSYSGGEK